MSDLDEQVEKLTAAISGLEAQRAALGDAVVDSALAALRLQLSQLDASRGEPAADDERKIVTIIFADVSGFTAMSEKLDPEEVRAFMNGCFESLVPIVRKYEGTIDKFIGDEIMALFGAPAAHEDDPERALRAGLEMIEAIAAFNRAHGTDLGLHIGINTGRVIAGKIGAEGQRNYSVMGDAVNLAARLEDASSRGEIFPYGVDWMALWPLIAIALDQNNLAQAIEHARALFGPNQHPLPPELMVITQKAIAAWQKNAREIARTDLEQAVQVAHKVAQL